MPVYFKLLSPVAPIEVLWHRIIWSALLTSILIHFFQSWRNSVKAITNRRQLPWLLLSTLFIAFNWLLFIWAISNNRMLEASLGYFINPLINMLLGYLFLKERLVPLQQAAAGLAVLGVAIQVTAYGSIPWVALGLGCSFGLYGLIRKRVSVDALTGLNVETMLLLPIALASLWMLNSPTSNLLQNTWQLNSLLLLAGPFTTIPLLLFVIASKRLTLTSLGFFQYIAPSLMFMLAVLIYDERVGTERWWTFGFIWTALALVSWHAMHRYRRQTAALSE